MAKKFPRIFRLEKNPNVTVGERKHITESESQEWNWEWRYCPKGRTSVELDNIKELLKTFSATNEQRDRWRWLLAKSEEFEVKALRKLVEINIQEREPVEHATTKWSKIVPKKVNIFVWRVTKGSIPVRVQLDRRGVDIPSLLCPMCNDCLESIDHVLVRCRISSMIWERVFKWWGLDEQNIVDVNQVLTLKGRKAWKEDSRKRWEGVVWSTLYILWRHRNEVVFGKKKLNVEIMLSELQWRIFLWLKGRDKKVCWNWTIWCMDPVALFKAVPSTDV